MKKKRNNKKSFAPRGKKGAGFVSDETMTVNQLAELLGIKKWGILKRIQRGELHPLRRGRDYCFLKSDIARMFNDKMPENSVNSAKGCIKQFPIPEADLRNISLDDLLYVEELADMLGMKKWGVLKRIQRGELPAIKCGKRYYFFKSRIMETIRILGSEESGPRNNHK